VLIGASLVLASCWSNPHDCDVACESAATHLAEIAMPETAVWGATVTFCQNSACASATLDTLAVGDFSQSGSTGAFYMPIDVGDSDDDDAATTDPTMTWITGQLEDVWFTNGDVYSLTVTDPSGATLCTNTATVAAYQLETVCGETCQEITISL
jgi:hypothetical protein